LKKIYLETPINKSLEFVKNAFDESLFEYLAPPIIPFQILEFGGCKKGDAVELKLGPEFFHTTWRSDITEELSQDSKWSFTDVGVKLPCPLKKWKHVHSVVKVDEHNCIIVDDINYDCENVVINNLIYPILYLQFKARYPLYKKYFSNLK
tara:strand:- start:58273 stop:58722 length:450 start_codon:yes stop_codon:yes gene_type:complete